ncbi:MAG TPA: hypothetical protein VMU18_07200, partial [Rhodoblastus sp.]|nr:hypothetical protein [Rhodoblastus sp.]
MSDAIVSITPQLRRYAHAALGCWPPAPRRPGETRPRVDQDADDLVHDALLDCWRAGARRQGDAGADDGLRLALYARVTALARLHVARNAAQSLAASGQDDVAEAPAAPMTHIPWAPELAALPRLALDLRALLALVTLERLTYAQAGAVLDMAEDQVLARLTVARARFASEIAGVVRTHL